MGRSLKEKAAAVLMLVLIALAGLAIFMGIGELPR